MKLQDIPQQEDIKYYFRKVMGEDKFPHAIMFFGRQGSAKLALAHALAQFLLCPNTDGHDSCGECNSCKKVDKWIHPDVHVVFPVVKLDGKKREDTVSTDFMKEWREILHDHPYFSFQDWTQKLQAENSPPNINTRECSELIKKLSLQTFEGKAKIMIIWMPEYLGKEGNRLLKLVEEPTDDTYILFVTEDMTAILPTMISRTQIIHVPSYSDEEIMGYIMKHSDISEEKARQLSILSDGDLGKAMPGVDPQKDDYTSLLFDWIRISYKADTQMLINFIDNMAKTGRQNQKDFLKYGMHFWREYLFSLYTGKRGNRMSDREYDVAVNMKKVINENQCFQLIELFNASIQHIQQNANAKISFMADSMAINSILRKEKIIIL